MQAMSFNLAFAQKENKAPHPVKIKAKARANKNALFHDSNDSHKYVV